MTQGGLFAGESALPSGLAYAPGFLTEGEERELQGIGTLDLREARYKEHTAKRRVASLGAGVCLASAATMRLRRFPPRKNAPVFTLGLAPRSAYVLRDDARWKWQHAIAATPALRYSVTLSTRAAP